MEKSTHPPARRLVSLVSASVTLVLTASAFAQSGQTGMLEDPREAALEESRALAAVGRFDEALRHAQTHVEMTEALPGHKDDLAEALVNLGRIEWQLNDHHAAELSLGRAIYLIEAMDGIVSRRLVGPLALLADVYSTQGRHAEAARVLNRAIVMTRRTDGLFNLRQLPLLEALAVSFEEVGDAEGVERELRFAVFATDQQLGPAHPQSMDAVMKLADSFLRAGRYDLARVHYQQVVEQAESSNASDTSTETQVRALLGVARSHRLQYANDPQSLAGPAVPIDPITGRLDLPQINSQRVTVIRPDRGGEEAARRAIDTLVAAPGPPTDLLFESLVELGDWYMTARKPDAAMPCYASAWEVLQSAPSDERYALLKTPRALLLRRPGAAIRSRERWEGTIAPRQIEFSMTVTATGEPRDIVTVTDDAPAGQVSQLRRALEGAIFSPRLEAGRPVETTDYRIIEYWYDLDSPTSSSTPSAGHKPAS